MASRIIVIDKDRHKNTKIKANPNLEHMKDRQMITVPIQEFGRAANNYPIVFVKDPNTGKFYCVVLLGFKQNENLFYAEPTWHSTYVPTIASRHPFILAPDENNPNKNQLSACLEEDSPYINTEEGDALFLDDGTESNFLIESKNRMALLFERELSTYKFVEKLLNLELVREIQVDFMDTNDKATHIKGLYTIDEIKFNDLDDTVICDLHKLGYLGPMYSMLSSLGQLYLMIKLKNLTSDIRIKQFHIEVV